MPTDPHADHSALQGFLDRTDFRRSGVVMTDLDGTAVLEREGRIFLPPSVEKGLKRVHAHGRPVVVNTLRFPRSVINVFAAEWHRVTGADLALVSLKGSQIGQVVRSSSGEFSFDEWHSTTLSVPEIESILASIDGMVADGVEDLLVFSYARDWRRGERIWTPRPEREQGVAQKYLSAAEVFSGSVAALRDALLSEPHCMIFLLIDLPHDRLMAYQHTNRNSFFTHAGRGKVDGARAIASHLGFRLADSLGAGDAPTDDFLTDVGYAVIVGQGAVDYEGIHHTARVAGVSELGDLLGTVADSLDP